MPDHRAERGVGRGVRGYIPRHGLDSVAGYPHGDPGRAPIAAAPTTDEPLSSSAPFERSPVSGDDAPGMPLGDPGRVPADALPIEDDGPDRSDGLWRI